MSELETTPKIDQLPETDQSKTEQFSEENKRMVNESFAAIKEEINANKEMWRINEIKALETIEGRVLGFDHFPPTDLEMDDLIKEVVGSHLDSESNQLLRRAVKYAALLAVQKATTTIQESRQSIPPTEKDS